MSTIMDIPEADIVTREDGRLAVRRTTIVQWIAAWQAWADTLERDLIRDLYLLPAHWKRPLRRIDNLTGETVAPVQPATEEDGA